MKIKHFAGYGTVNATKVKDDNTLHIHLAGNHEWGLNRNDTYDVFNWLVKKFDKAWKNGDYFDWRLLNPQMTIINGYEKINGIDTETCDYIFNY